MGPETAQGSGMGAVGTKGGPPARPWEGTARGSPSASGNGTSALDGEQRAPLLAPLLPGPTASRTPGPQVSTAQHPGDGAAWPRSRRGLTVRRQGPRRPGALWGEPGVCGSPLTCWSPRASLLTSLSPRHPPGSTEPFGVQQALEVSSVATLAANTAAEQRRDVNWVPSAGPALTSQTLLLPASCPLVGLSAGLWRKSLDRRGAGIRCSLQ